MANLDIIRGRQVVVPLTNKSGGGVVAGDVVIIDASNDSAFTTTTSARSEVSVGIAQETIANNASGRILTHGYAALVNVPASVTRGHYIETHTVAKQATGNSARRSGSFGQFITGGTTPIGWLWGGGDPTASSSAPPDCKEALCSADTAIVTANTWTDITGMTMSLAAGDWLIEATAYVEDSNAAATSFGLAIHNGTTQVATTGVTKDTGAGNRANLTVRKRVTLGGTTTVKIQGLSTRGSSATTFKTSETFSGVGIANTASSMHATKVTSI